MADREKGLDLLRPGKRRNDEQLELDSQRLEGLGLLACGIAHDFNNVLSGIMGVASCARMKNPGEGEMARAMDDIIRISEDAKEMAKTLLFYGRGGEVAEAVFDMETLGRDMIKLAGYCDTRHPRIEFHSDGGDHFVRGNPSRISQVLLNLILNASEAIEEEQGLIEIDLDNWEEDGSQWVRVRVIDNGVGMDSQLLGRIFDPFFTTKSTGSGLGLSAVKRIVESQGGEIKVSSTPGKGTTFTLLLLRTDPGQAAPPAALSSFGGREGLLLVGEDSESFRGLEFALKEYGYHVFATSTVTDALDTSSREHSRIKLIVLDICHETRPVGDLTYALLENVPLAKLLFTGEINDTMEVEEFLQSGVANFLQRPCSPEETTQKIRGILDQGRGSEFGNDKKG